MPSSPCIPACNSTIKGNEYMLVHWQRSLTMYQLTFALGKTQEARVVSLIQSSFSFLARWKFVGGTFRSTCTESCLLTQNSCKKPAHCLCRPTNSFSPSVPSSSILAGLCSAFLCFELSGPCLHVLVRPCVDLSRESHITLKDETQGL